MRKIFRSIRAALYKSKAYDLSSQGKYDRALTELKKSYAVLGTEFGHELMPYHFNALAGYLLNELGDHCNAIKVLENTKKQIINEDSLSGIDKNYLNHYLDRLIVLSADELGRDDIVSDIRKNFFFDFSRLSEVNQKIKLEFPMDEIRITK